jgi:hypothetical protein
MPHHVLLPRIAMLTKHDKVRLIAPVLHQAMGIELIHTDGFDTDNLGSFAGEQPRIMTPAECALRKAALAAELTGEPLGLGSEGSFSPGPYGLGTYNLELLCCVNVNEGWQVTGRFYGPAAVQHWSIETLAQLETALSTVPSEQKLLLQQHAILHKGLSINDARLTGSTLLATGSLTLSYDLRAHCCPERQQHIVLAAQDLVARLQSQCPQCNTPGFWPDKAIPGLPCQDCDSPTSLTRLRQACCQRCHYTESQAVAQLYADAQYCPVCNP